MSMHLCTAPYRQTWMHICIHITQGLCGAPTTYPGKESKWARFITIKVLSKSSLPSDSNNLGEEKEKYCSHTEWTRNGQAQFCYFAMKFALLFKIFFFYAFLSRGKRITRHVRRSSGLLFSRPSGRWAASGKAFTCTLVQLWVTGSCPKHRSAQAASP